MVKGVAVQSLLQVRLDDIEDVMTILEQVYLISTGVEDFDTNVEQATCPAYGYSFLTKSTACSDCGLCFGEESGRKISVMQ